MRSLEKRRNEVKGPREVRATGVAKKRHVRFQRLLRCECLEDRRMLAVTSYPELPGLTLVDPRPDQFAGQVIYLDFEGEQNVTYNGPVVVEGIDVPPFQAPGELAGQEQQVIALVVGQLNELFAPVHATFTLDQPEIEGTYSTVYIGDGAWADGLGDFLGLAEQVDLRNQDPADKAFVFDDLPELVNADLESLSVSLADLVAHESGHLLGYMHDDQHAATQASEGPLDDVAFGVTLITHGFSLFLAYQEWVDKTADLVTQRIAHEYNTDTSQVARYHIEVLGEDAGYIYKMSGVSADTAETGEVVITVDWSDFASLSGLPTDRIARLLADGFDASYPDPEIGITRPLASMPIHLIGHSRGASVISDMARQLGEVGVWVDQLTFLDPHPLNFLEGLGLPDAPVSVYDNVAYADNYWRSEGVNPVELTDVDGRPIEGAENTRLSESYFDDPLDIGYPSEHSDVHAWYRGTVPSYEPPYSTEEDWLITSDWYEPLAYEHSDLPSQTRENMGYSLSRIAGRNLYSAPLRFTNTGDWPNIGYLGRDLPASVRPGDPLPRATAS